MTWLSKAAIAGAAVLTVFLTYQEGRAAGEIEGRLQGTAAGYTQAVNEYAQKSGEEKRKQEAIDEARARASSDYRERAEAEIARLGGDATRAKRELAAYLNEGKKSGSQSCKADSMGGSRVDPGIVGLLNEARAKTNPDLRAGRAPAAAAAGRADDAGTGPQAPTWADLALSDQESSQTYLALAVKHDKLVGWVQTYCTNNNNKESGE